jgi:predicted transcriptional regulator
MEVARLYLEGKYQHEIAEILGVSQQQVSYDLKEIQLTWQDMSVAQLTELKARELARIDNLERTYWQAWEKSQQPKETTSTAKEGEKVKVGKRSEQRNGNPQFLQGVQWCIERRIKLLGLDAPVRSEVSSALAVTQNYNDMDAAELSRLYTAKLQNAVEN